MTIRVVPNEFCNAPACYRSLRNLRCIELLQKAFDCISKVGLNLPVLKWNWSMKIQQELPYKRLKWIAQSSRRSLFTTTLDGRYVLRRNQKK